MDHQENKNAFVFWHEIVLIGVALLLIFYCYYASKL